MKYLELFKKYDEIPSSFCQLSSNLKDKISAISKKVNTLFPNKELEFLIFNIEDLDDDEFTLKILEDLKTLEVLFRTNFSESPFSIKNIDREKYMNTEITDNMELEDLQHFLINTIDVDKYKNYRDTEESIIRACLANPNTVKHLDRILDIIQEIRNGDFNINYLTTLNNLSEYELDKALLHLIDLDNTILINSLVKYPEKINGSEENLYDFVLLRYSEVDSKVKKVMIIKLIEYFMSLNMENIDNIYKPLINNMSDYFFYNNDRHNIAYFDNSWLETIFDIFSLLTLHFPYTANYQWHLTHLFLLIPNGFFDTLDGYEVYSFKNELENDLEYRKNLELFIYYYLDYMQGNDTELVVFHRANKLFDKDYIRYLANTIRLIDKGKLKSCHVKTFKDFHKLEILQCPNKNNKLEW